MSRTDPPSPTSSEATPQTSRRSSSPRSTLTLDLSNLPPVITPAPPSNTIIITRLTNPEIFLAKNLHTLRETISQYGEIHTWSPFKSFQRIIIVFHDVAIAKAIKDSLDGEVIMNCLVRIYFANHTNLSPTATHLAAPKLDKQFFISPPPSPPHDWESRLEGEPNKTVHAEDLAAALSKLHASVPSPVSDMDVDEPISANGRMRSGSVTVVYHPHHHGSRSDLPAIEVEDTEFVESPGAESPVEESDRPILAHTARPPVELMEH